MLFVSYKYFVSGRETGACVCVFVGISVVGGCVGFGDQRIQKSIPEIRTRDRDCCKSTK